MRASALVLVTVAAACVPAIPSLEGKACDAEHPCGEGYACNEAPCQRRGTQVLANADFEAGAGLPAWNDSGNSLVSAQQQRVRTGDWAARCAAEKPPFSSYFGLNSDRAAGAVLTAGSTWCASAFVDRGNVPPGERLRFHIRTWNAADDFRDAPAEVAPGDGGWQRVTVSTVIAPLYDVGIGVRFAVDDFDGGEYFADDVELWAAVPGGVCVATP